MRRIVPFVCLCAGVVPVARAQFTFSANGNTVATGYNFGNVPPGVAASASFQLQNTSRAAASLTYLNVAGTGFSISGGPALPQKLSPQATVTFTVNFEGTVDGGYSAFLLADGVTALLTAAVVPGLTYQVQTASGTQNLGSASAIDFGSVDLGQTSSLKVVGSNSTTQVLTVPAIVVSGSEFSLSNPPSANSYALAGFGIALVLPQPHVNILLSQAQSAQPGTVTVTFDSPAAASGSGTLTLEFQPTVSGATDPAIVFASGSQSVPFTFSAGDIQASFGSVRSIGFQTGTTAGAIQFRAQIGNLSDQKSVTIPAAAVSFTGVQANRYAGSIAVEIIGFDNARSAGPVVFAFYDAEADRIAPGAIPVDATAAFTQYFTTSQGGSFSLSATFPITGDASQITYVQAAFSNSAGTSTTVRTSLQ